MIHKTLMKNNHKNCNQFILISHQDFIKCKTCLLILLKILYEHLLGLQENTKNNYKTYWTN